MKTMIKKTIASLIAMATVTTCASALVSAEEANAIDISYKTLEESIVANDGTTIPAGAVAVDVSISDNTGFNGSSVKFDVNGSTVITDSTGTPVVDNGNVLDDAVFSGAQNGNTVVIAGSSADKSTADGSLFTFYMSKSADISVVNKEFSTATIEDVEDVIMPMGLTLSYIIGDADGDNDIDINDASVVLTAIGKANGALPVSLANKNIRYYYPDARVLFANASDGNLDGVIMNPRNPDGSVAEELSDPQQILKYYSAKAVGNVYNVEGWYIGEEKDFTIEFE